MPDQRSSDVNADYWLVQLLTAGSRAFECVSTLKGYCSLVRVWDSRYGKCLGGFESAIQTLNEGDLREYSAAMASVVGDFRNAWFERGACNEGRMIVQRYCDVRSRSGEFVRSWQGVAEYLVMRAAVKNRDVDQTRRGGVVAETWCHALDRLAMELTLFPIDSDELRKLTAISESAATESVSDWRILVTFLHSAIQDVNGLADNAIEDIEVGVKQEFALAEVFLWEVEAEAEHGSTGSEASKSRKRDYKAERKRLGVSVELQMMTIFKSDERCVDWTAEEFADLLQCSPSTVKKENNAAWRAILKERARRKELLKNKQ